MPVGFVQALLVFVVVSRSEPTLSRKAKGRFQFDLAVPYSTSCGQATAAPRPSLVLSLRPEYPT